MRLCFQALIFVAAAWAREDLVVSEQDTIVAKWVIEKRLKVLPDADLLIRASSEVLFIRGIRNKGKIVFETTPSLPILAKRLPPMSVYCAHRFLNTGTFVVNHYDEEKAIDATLTGSKQFFNSGDVVLRGVSPPQGRKPDFTFYARTVTNRGTITVFGSAAFRARLSVYLYGRLPFRDIDFINEGMIFLRHARVDQRFHLQRDATQPHGCIVLMEGAWFQILAARRLINQVFDFHPGEGAAAVLEVAAAAKDVGVFIRIGNFPMGARIVLPHFLTTMSISEGDHRLSFRGTGISQMVTIDYPQSMPSESFEFRDLTLTYNGPEIHVNPPECDQLNHVNTLHRTLNRLDTRSEWFE